MAPLESDSISALVRKAYVVSILFLFLSCSGCGATYILQAASGQFSLLKNSIKIEKALTTDSLNDETKSRLQLIPEIKKFGEETLGLRKTGSYEKVYLKSGKSPIYVISACPRDSLNGKTWWFPIVGNMPYLGFFDLEKAEKKKGKLENEDMDVIIRTAAAYSTLGWFDDPVTLNLLEGSIVGLVETIIHEMTHTTLYIKGNGEFNEGLANLVGKIGAIEFFRNKYGTKHPFTIEAENNLFDELLFSSYINSLSDDLIKLYNSDISYHDKIRHREEIFRAYHAKFTESQVGYKTERYKYFSTNDFNNAYILSIALYRREFPKFYKMLEENNGSVLSLLKRLEENKRG